MGQGGYERARDVFSWESIGDKTVEVYQSVLDEQKKWKRDSAGSASSVTERRDRAISGALPPFCTTEGESCPKPSSNSATSNSATTARHHHRREPHHQRGERWVAVQAERHRQIHRRRHAGHLPSLGRPRVHSRPPARQIRRIQAAHPHRSRIG